MAIFRGDASEVYALAADLAAIPAKAVPALRTGMKAGGDVFAKAWQANAAATSGVHGKHYPKSISAELAFDLGGVSVDVGPDSSIPQGGMGKGFEFGSQNQPPHLDGVKAMDAVAPEVEQIIGEAVEGVF